MDAQELADMFEVYPRTIYRDIDTINLAGIPIRSISGVGGGFEIMPEYKIDKNVFSTADLSTILMGLSSLSNVVRGDELVNALAKVKSFISAEKAKDIEIAANQICIDLSPWMGNRNIRPYLEMIKTALQDHKLLRFEYTAHHGNKTVRTVEPYQLVLKSSHWYFYGYCYNRDDYRLFIAIIKKPNNNQTRRTNGSSPEEKHKRGLSGWHPGGGPNCGFSSSAGWLSSWTTFSQLD